MKRTPPIDLNEKLHQLAAVPDMAQLAQQIDDNVGMLGRRNAPVPFAPPSKEERLSETVKTFGELPTKQIDEVIMAAEAEIATLKDKAQEVRNIYVERTLKLLDDINRLREGVRLSTQTMEQLRDQCERLNKIKGPTNDPNAA